MDEHEKVICKTCRQIKTRYQMGRFPNSKDKRWIDETGKQWSGKNCPPCHTELTKQRTKNARTKKTTPSI